MSVVVFASFGLTLMKRLATWPPSNTQSTVSPPKTVAIFSSAGEKDKGGLEQTGPYDGRRLRLGYGDGTRRVWFKAMRRSRR